MKRLLLALLCAVFVLPCRAAEPIAYDRDITPILRTYCSGCHNGRDMEGEFSVETFASLRRGGAGSGDPIAPGDAAASVLIQRIESSDGDHMPPADEPQLPAAELATLIAWIAAGAAAPADDVSILETLTVPKLPPHVGLKPVTALAVSPDGARLAVVRGRTVEILAADAVTGPAAPAPLLTISDLPGVANAAHYSRDGSRIVVAGGITGLSGVAELRDAATGRLVRSFGGHRDVLYDAELSPDEKTLATAGYDRSIKLWNVADGAALRSIDVHNGAVFDLAWHPSGKLLGSASADETIKLWRAADGVRLDTLSQPQGEMMAVAFTPDGRRVIGAGRDKRIHLWKLMSLDAPAINPPLLSRFAHESPIIAIGLSADGRHLFTSAEDRSLKCWSVPDMALEHDHPRQRDLVAAIVPQGKGGVFVGRMDGSLETVAVVVNPTGSASAARASDVQAGLPSPLADGAARSNAEPADDLATADDREPNDTPAQAVAVSSPVTIKGTVGRPGDVDCFRFPARAGEQVLVGVTAAATKSKLDSRIEVLDAQGRPIEQVVLQATRDSWFTFRGKNSSQSDDFRIHNWAEMELDEYLYANGEVVRLWRYPEGADSGFLVSPGEGARHTFFGTSAVTHALGEPAWVVAPLPPGARPAPNGLPVFTLYYENDDEPTRRLGADSQLIFTPPADGEYVVRLGDVRGFGADSSPADYHYALAIRPPRPGFSVTVSGTNLKVSPGSARELVFKATRMEGFAGPIRIGVDNVPQGFTFHGPIEIEAGQTQALAVISAAADAVAPDEAADKAVAVRATATIANREVVQDLGTLGDIQLADAAKVTLAIVAAGDASPADGGGPVTFSIRPGQTISAKAKAVRHDFKDRIDLGKTTAGRNLPYGTFVDNIGLNGLLIVEGQDERDFFITAAPVAKPGRRLFHLRTAADGGQVSLPAVIDVLPADVAERE